MARKHLGQPLARRTLMLLSALCVLVSAAPAQAKECEGVAMPEQVQVDDKTLLLNGMGVREATVFSVNVYVAGLYLEHRSRDGERIATSEETKRMLLVFVRGVSRGDMVEAIRAGFKASAGAEYPKLEARVEKFVTLLPNLDKGDRLSFTYRPEKGLEVTGKKQSGVIPGADFARALFLIWLGAHPPNAGLKRGLLGGECG
jgi:Chalcone isomerase-like